MPPSRFPALFSQPSGESQNLLHVQVALRARADQRLLVRTLRDAGLTPESVTLPDGKADLVIVDAWAWEHSRERLRSVRENAYPLVFPILAIAGKETASAAWAYRELGADIDDLVELPTSRAVLLSGGQSAAPAPTLRHRPTTTDRPAKLNAVDRALQTLHACNEMMVRESTEEGLLQSVCEVIAQFEGYAGLGRVYRRQHAEEGGQMLHCRGRRRLRARHRRERRCSPPGRAPSARPLRPGAPRSFPTWLPSRAWRPGKSRSLLRLARRSRCP